MNDQIGMRDEFSENGSVRFSAFREDQFGHAWLGAGAGILWQGFRKAFAKVTVIPSVV